MDACCVELFSIFTEVNHNASLYTDLTTALDGLLGDWKFEDVVATIDLWEEQFHKMREAHVSFDNELTVFLAKNVGPESEDVVQDIIKRSREMLEKVDQLYEQMKQTKERIECICEQNAAIDAALEGDEFGIETSSDEEDYEAESVPPKRQRGQ